MIGMLFSKDLGEVVGDIEPDINNRKYKVKFPHRVHMTEKGPVLINVLGLVTEDSIELEVSDLIVKGIFTLDSNLEKEIKSVINPDKGDGLILPSPHLKL